MSIRVLKIILIVFDGLQGWFYVAGNIANWNTGIEAVGYVTSMVEHNVYSNRIFPPITNPVLITLIFICIIFGEFLVGALSLIGAWDLWKVRHESAETFNSSKHYALLGSGMAMVVWFGGFVVIGGALFQMWQTTIGSNSFQDAFVFAASSGIVLLFVSSQDI